MGEAKRRRNVILERLCSEQSFCVFCGGITRGTTVDHVPPITCFDRKDRPGGLEFLACLDCNSGSRIDDLILGMMSRLFPTHPATPSGHKEFGVHAQAVRNNAPEVIRELLPDDWKTWLISHASYDSGRLYSVGFGQGRIAQALECFGAKFGLAMHFQATGRIIPPGGAAVPLVFTNGALLSGDIPSEIGPTLGPPRTLQQGRKNAWDQFSYSSRIADDPRGTSMHLAAFRLSFTVITFVTEDVRLSRFAEAPRYRPGFLTLPLDQRQEAVGAARQR